MIIQLWPTGRAHPRLLYHKRQSDHIILVRRAASGMDTREPDQWMCDGYAGRTKSDWTSIAGGRARRSCDGMVGLLRTGRLGNFEDKRGARPGFKNCFRETK